MKLYKSTAYLQYVFCFLFSIIIFTGKAQDAEKKTIDQIIAVVGSNIILESHIEAQYAQMKAQGYATKGDMHCEILEQLLFQKLLVNQAKIDSIEVTEKQVDMELDRRLNAFIEQAGGPKELEKFFDKTIPEIKEDFREVVKEQLVTQRMQSEITIDVTVTPSEVKRFFRNLPKDSIPLIDAELEILQIVKAPAISEEAKNKIKEKLMKFREQILNGEKKFATIAVIHSQDPGSASKGGELGFVNRSSQLAPAFKAAAFNLKEEGEISKVVETEFGYHIIQLTERRGQRIKIRHILMQPEVSTISVVKAKTTLDSIATQIRIDSLTFKEAAAMFSDDEDTKKNGGLLINPYTGTSKFTPQQIKQIDQATGFVIRRLKVGEISEPYQATDMSGKMVFKIAMLKSKTQPHVANLDDDYQRIQDLALENKKQNTVNDWVKDKQKSTYVRIDESYKNCNFSFKGWIK